jgi:ketosteroid isomerase-like protein
MPAGNVTLVRRLYDEGLLDTGHDQLLDAMEPDVEYVNPPEAVDPGIRRGRDEVAKALAALRSFDSMATELHELFDAGDHVVAHVTFRTRSGGSDHQVSQPEAHTWTFRDGRIVRFEWGRDLDAALEAVGLSR